MNFSLTVFQCKSIFSRFPVLSRVYKEALSKSNLLETLEGGNVILLDELVIIGNDCVLTLQPQSLYYLHHIFLRSQSPGVWDGYGVNIDVVLRQVPLFAFYPVQPKLHHRMGYNLIPRGELIGVAVYLAFK